MGDKDWQDMQLGCLWQGPNIISVNARGHLIYHSLETPDQPLRVVKVSFLCDRGKKCTFWMGRYCNDRK